MSKTAGSTPSGGQTGSAVNSARPAATGAEPAVAAGISWAESRPDGDDHLADSLAGGYDRVAGSLAGGDDHLADSRSGGDDHLAGSRPGADDLPSWPRVIATTLQLWVQRRVLRHHDGPAARRPRRRAGAFGLAIVVFAAGALTIALAQSRDNSGAGTGSRGADRVKLSITALKVAEANRQNAAAWVAAQVSHSAIVSCDPVMCAALQARHFPAGDLLALGPSATDPMGSAIVMSTIALRNQFGQRLPDVYAPVVIASFGTGPTRVDVRIEAPDGSKAYLVAQRADLLARQASGQQLLRNKFLHVSGVSRQEIAAGRVDARLLITLAALTAQLHRVYISQFGEAGPGAAADVPLRMVRIAALIPAKHGKPATYLRSVQKFLAAQQAPFRASSTVVRLPGDQTVVQIQFAAPSSLGLLGRRASP